MTDQDKTVDSIHQHLATDPKEHQFQDEKWWLELLDEAIATADRRLAEREGK